MDVRLLELILPWVICAVAWFTLGFALIACGWVGLLHGWLRGQHEREMAFLTEHPRLSLVPMEGAV